MMKDSTYALHHGSIVHVDNVPSGLSCECTCPACGTRMIARHGKIKTHHFAHYHAKTCATGYQTAVHMRAKELLSEKKELFLPPYQFEYGNKTFHVPSAKVQVQHVELEKRLDKIIPDVVVTTAKGKTILVEIFVTHKIDDEKLAKIKDMDMPTIEIDLSDNELDDQKLIEVMNGKNSKRNRWVYYGSGSVSFYTTKIDGNTEQLTIDEQGRIMCPILKDVSWDKDNQILGNQEHCSGCDFLLKKNEYGSIACMGKNYFEDIYQCRYLPQKRKSYYFNKYFNPKSAFYAIKKLLLDYIKVPYGNRLENDGDWHPLNRLRMESISSIKEVFDVCKIPRLKISGKDVEGKDVSFYICVTNSTATMRLWFSKWYKGYVKAHDSVVVVYEKVQVKYDQYQYKAIAYLKDVPADFDTNTPPDDFMFVNNGFPRDIPLNGIEEKEFYKIGNDYYAKCYRSYRGCNDFAFVPAKQCSLCPRYRENCTRTITKFHCFTDKLPVNTPIAPYFIQKDDSLLREVAISKELVTPYDKYVFIQMSI